MSDRNWFGILLVLAGWAVILVPSRETAVRISSFVRQVTGFDPIIAALVVVVTAVAMILSGVFVLLWKCR